MPAGGAAAADPLQTVETTMPAGGAAAADPLQTVETTMPAGGDAAADPLQTVETTMPAGGDAAADPLQTGSTRHSLRVSTSDLGRGWSSRLWSRPCCRADPLILEREEYLWQGKQKFVIDHEGYAVAVHNDLPASLAAFPRGLVAVTLRPVPWEAGIIGKRMVAGFESIIWLPLFVLAGVGAWIRRRDSHVVALPASLVLALTLSAAVTQGNLGTAVRHRGQILFALSILAVAGLQAALDHWRSGRMS
jgi:hypothetical protein